MMDEQYRRDQLADDILRVDRIAKYTLGKDAEAHWHPRGVIVVSLVANYCELTSGDLDGPDDALSRHLADTFAQLQGRR